MAQVYTTFPARPWFHKQVKAHVALQGKSLIDFVEEACRAKMQDEGRTLKEQPALYEVHPPASP